MSEQDLDRNKPAPDEETMDGSAERHQDEAEDDADFEGHRHTPSQAERHTPQVTDRHTP